MSEEKKDYYAPMHTAEHILNATMMKMFGCKRSENCHIEKKKSKCDFEIPNSPDEIRVKQIESNVREIIDQHLQVIEFYYPFEQAEKEFDLHRVDKTKNDTIRIIQIGSYDRCPCIGQHVKNTSEIGDFRITTWSWENGILRLRFKV